MIYVLLVRSWVQRAMHFQMLTASLQIVTSSPVDVCFSNSFLMSTSLKQTVQAEPIGQKEQEYRQRYIIRP
jgi:hypothetical protein